ncbi:HNH endonuclease [Sporosarcina sp. E16_8]|uniref:HNH endonuclease n=1 Tax=Sporosarcina sp. E16_8 TaxID=2789295 RepID=UPI001A9307C2|nr:HNH endonuclease [Sporosarcina sp. E16_8]MBO0586442.1 HNH endonuclease [Sporosarcina sp. E16_8]
MKKKNKGLPLTLSYDSNKIYFKDEKDNVWGITDYQNKFYDELLGVNWYVKLIEKKPYVYTGAKKWGKAKKLHQVIMQLWYGEVEFQDSLKDKIVIDHLDNNEKNNLIENLAFAPKNHNTAKGLIYDKESKKLKPDILVHWYKDFATREYQFIVGFNNDSYLIDEKESYLVDRIELIYEDNYRIIYEDVSGIVGDLLESGVVDLKRLRYKGTPHIVRTPLINKEQLNEGQIFAYDQEGNLVLLKSDKVRRLSLGKNQDLHKK